MQYSSFTSIIGMKDVSTVIISVILVLVQLACVLFFAIFLHRSSEEQIDARGKTIKSLYKSLDHTSKLRLFYASVFYIVRTVVVIIIVTKPSFGVQAAFL
jgi:flagellar basal body-associated protein FliL